jgi:hypothetical protein
MEHLLSNLQALDQAERDVLRFRNPELVLESTVLELKQNDSEGNVS